MHSFDICDFPADFLTHLYNFAADEFGKVEPVEPPNPPESILFPQECQETLPPTAHDFHPDAILTGRQVESDPIPPYADPTSDEIRQSGECFPLLSEAFSHTPDPASRSTIVSHSQSSIRRGMASASKAVPIAPLQTYNIDAKERAIEDAISEEAERARELELRALRAYHRKIRNRESAARSNLARKRRREMLRIELAKKQRIFQGELAPAVS